jgi:tRNA threonylcarbamoyl adenosine modification protein (Sua5/YciO/YrdC/YwlC family)
MSELLEIHPENPESRLVKQVADVLRGGGLIVYPTDSCYAFGFHMGDKGPIREIQRIRNTDKSHNFTLVCRDLSDISEFAQVENWHYRMLKAHTPGPYTFILQANRRMPRRLQNERRKTIGIRVPDHPVPQALLEELGEPFMSSTLLMPGDDVPMTDPDDMLRRLNNDVDLIVWSGSCGIEPTTVVEITGDYPVVLREGKGSAADFV